jgi:hypothetical protein
MKKDIVLVGSFGALLIVAVLVAVSWGGSNARPVPLAPLEEDPAQAPGEVIVDDGKMSLPLSKSGTLEGITLTPILIEEDSRCPLGVNCIQAGIVRVRTVVEGASGAYEHVFMLGEPFIVEGRAITLLEVSPEPLPDKGMILNEYRFVFGVESRALSYENASEDLIRVSTPTPGAVTGKEFLVKGEARGTWFFEASFPIEVLDQNGARIAIAIAQAEGDWMTTEFVPFSATVRVPETYIGPAIIVLRKDNPSGLPEHDASASSPITIEY